jgi:preprotein translocase subunit SecA
MYKKLSGMTGTAKTEESEFRDIYNMEVVCIPTNEPVIREDALDYIFISQKEKFDALIEEVERRHKLGQPILIGTIAVETSEHVSTLLSKKRINHEILNAKNHAREAEIIAKAGLKGSVTLATNMAGRGTDIKLGEGVVELGGLAVLGSERHESRRIDNQLRGRSGRQGDPGFSRFFISTEDELLIRFGGDRFKIYIDTLKKTKENGEAITSKIIQRSVTGAQKRIEGNNFDSRKNLLKFDDVLRVQREIIYKERNDVLFLETIEPSIVKMIENVGLKYVTNFFKQTGKDKYDIDDAAIIAYYDGIIFPKGTLSKDYLQTLDDITLPKYIYDLINKEFLSKKAVLEESSFNEFLKVVLLRVIDTYWMKHIDTMSELRQGVSLQSIGQNNPLIVYQQRGLFLFNEMRHNIERDVVMHIVRAKFVGPNPVEQRKSVVGNTHASDGKTEVSKSKQFRPNTYSNKNKPWH